MSEPPAAPVPYRVVYSEHVRTRLRQLVAHAKRRGLAREVLEAVKEIDRRLRIFPQFGQPLLDLTHEPGQLCLGVVPPLVVRFALHEERRLVFVTTPLAPLPRAGL